MRKERIVVLMASVVMATATWAQAVTDKSTVNNGNGSLKVENGKAGNAGLMARQGYRVTGCVTDANGEGLPGVTVTVRGTKKRTLTDIDGNYTIEVDKSQALVFTYIGMQQHTESVKGRTVVNVRLMDNAQSLGDVVVIGAYGTAQKRSDQVGSAYQVNAKDLQNMPQMRLDKMLDGLVPGVKIDINSDSPDNSRPRYNVRVRGDASLSASNEPLWIVDGSPLYTGESTNLMPGISYTISPLSFLNPEDIESITVLKDATQTSIYGADGANGVILVTTKHGKKGKMNVRLNAQFGIAQIDKSTAPKVLNASQYLSLAHAAYVNAGRNPAAFPFLDNELNVYSQTDTDWRDVFYGTGNTFLTDLSINGGSDKTDYYLSGSYYENQATVKGNQQQRFSIRTNFNYQLLKDLKATFNLSLSYNRNTLFNPGRDYYEMLPIISPYNPDGTMRLYNRLFGGYASDGSEIWNDEKFFNSVAEREENINKQNALFVNTNFMISYTIIKGLKYTGQFGVDFQETHEEKYDAMSNWSAKTSGGYATRNNLSLSNWNTIHRLNYNATFGKHTIGAVAGFEANSRQYTVLGATGEGFINDRIQDISYANVRTGSNSSKTTRKASLLAQASYSFDKRYYLTVNARRDGNSQFGSDVRWANFSSVGVSWNIHNEKFFHVPFINILKLKTSYGANGNSRLGSREAKGLYSYGDSYSYNGENGGVQSGSANRTLSWETTYKFNAGLRVRMFSRVDLEVEVYRDRTKDLISNLDVSRTTGDTRVYRNVGEIVNKGIEVTLTTNNFVAKKDGDFYWNTDLNLSSNNNKLTKLYNGIQKNMGTTVWKEGYDIHTYNLVRWAGVDPYDGAPLWLDLNGNVTRTYSEANRVPGKTSNPSLAGGITNTLGYKGFTLRFLINYTIGGYSFSSFGRSMMSDGLYAASENQAVDQVDYWQKSGDIAGNPKPYWGISTKSIMNSTRFLYNRTNFRLQNVALTYQIPRDVTKRLHIHDCTVNLVGDNLLILSPYSGKNRNSYKTCMSGYPSERTISLGLNVGF